MFENPRRGRASKKFYNFPKILDVRSSSEQIFSKNWRWVPLKSTSVVSIFALHFQHFRAEVRDRCFVWTEKFPLSLNILWSRNTVRNFFFLEPPFSHFLPRETTKSKRFLVRYFILGKWLLTSFLVSKFINWARLVLTRPQSSLTISPEWSEGLFLRTMTTGDESGSSQSFFL